MAYSRNKYRKHCAQTGVSLLRASLLDLFVTGHESLIGGVVKALGLPDNWDMRNMLSALLHELEHEGLLEQDNNTWKRAAGKGDLVRRMARDRGLSE